MDYNEWIKGKTGLFEEISNINKFKFFNDHSPSKIDRLYQNMYGQKPVPSNVQSMSVADVAELVVVRFGESWEKQHDIMFNEIMAGVEQETQDTGTSTNNTTSSSSNNQTDKTSAFNENSLTVEGGNDDTSESETTQDGTSDNTKTKKSFDVALKQLRLYTSSFVVNTVCEDVKKLTSLSIY